MSGLWAIGIIQNLTQTEHSILSTKQHAQIILSFRPSDIRFAESHSLLGTLGLFYLGQREEEKDKNHHVSNTIILKNILKFIMNKNEFLEAK